MEISPVEKNLWCINDGVTRCYLAVGEKSALLTDLGFPGLIDLKAEVRKLTGLPVTPVLTHGHWDHLGAVGDFPEFYVSPVEVPFLKNEIISRAAQFSYLGDADTICKKLLPRPMKEGDVFDLGGLKFTVTELPGHTAGSVALVNEAEGYMLSGDSFQSGAVLLHSSTSDIKKYYASLRKALDSGVDRFYCAHGESCPLSREQVRSIYNCAEDFVENSRRPEPFHLVIPGDDLWLYEHKFGGFQIFLGPVSDIPLE